MNIKKKCFLLLLPLFLISCSQDGNESEYVNSKNNDFNMNSLNLRSANYQLEEKLTITKTTSYLSQLFLNMGVVEIEVTNEDDLVRYDFKTGKMFGINGEGTNFENYTIELHEGAISINSNPEIKLTILDDQPYIITPSYRGFINSEEYINDKNFNLLYVFMNELITPEDNKLNASEALSVGGGCSWWNTYYVYSTAVSISVAEANLPDEIAFYSTGFNSLDVSGCSMIGGVDSSCIWGNHLCIASQGFCCD